MKGLPFSNRPEVERKKERKPPFQPTDSRSKTIEDIDVDAEAERGLRLPMKEQGKVLICGVGLACQERRKKTRSSTFVLNE